MSSVTIPSLPAPASKVLQLEIKDEEPIQRYIKPYDWQSIEESGRPTHIYVWGHDQDNNKSVVVIDDFPHCAFFELPSFVNSYPMQWTEGFAKIVFEDVKKVIGDDLIKFRFCPKEKLYYYRPNKKYPFLFLLFANKDALDRTVRLLDPSKNKKGFYMSSMGNINLRSYEVEIPYITKLIVTHDISYTDWLTFQAVRTDEKSSSRKTTLANEYHISYKDFKKSEKEWHVTPDFFSFDLETYSTNPNKMPDKYADKDMIYLVTIDYFPAKGKREQYAILVGDSDEPTKGQLIRVKTELELIYRFARLINDLNPDVITGYNINGYDWSYLNVRLTRLLKKWPKIGRIINREPYFKESNWESSGYGINVNEILYMDGRINVDMMPTIKRDFKFPKYSLEYVAQTILGYGKNKITFKDMFKAVSNLHNAKTDVEKKEAKAKMKEYVDYGLKDAVIVVDLIIKLNTWIGISEMAAISYVTPSQLITRGQQIRVDSQNYMVASKIGYVMDKREGDSSGYTGGAVADPVPGMHKSCIVLDFASLYPSIMIAFNICYTTLVPPEDRSIPDSMCHVIEFDQEEKGEGKEEEEDEEEKEEEEGKKEVKKVVKHYRYRFIKQEYRVGVIPTRLKDLLIARAKAREEIKINKKKIDELKSSNAIEEKITQQIKDLSLANVVLDKKQLAIKVAANSMYGFLGVGKGAMRALIEGARSVTAMGRQLIGQAADYIKNRYKGDIIYGDTDSVMVDLHITDRKQINKIGRDLGEEISKIFPPPLKMEFEAAGDLLCFKKKKYAMAIIDDNGNPTVTDKNGNLALKLRGIILARRDNFPFVREIYGKILISIFNNVPLVKVLQYLEDQIINLYSGKVPIEDLAYIRTLGASYAKETYFMAVFANNLRADGKPAVPGERLEYIIIYDPRVKNTGPRMRSLDQYYERKETNREEQPDYLHYLEKGIKTPIDQLISFGYMDEVKKYPNIMNKAPRARTYATIDKPVFMYINSIKSGKFVFLSKMISQKPSFVITS